jgi:16S rRNA G1207 methylase RsmC
VPLDPDTLKQLRREISFNETLRGRQLHFRTTWGLFSPKAIDEGTRLLLEHLEVQPDDRAIDLGCGYGPIGLTIATLAPQGEVLMVDKDFVAVEYANRNAELNRLANAKAMLSDGLKHIGDERFTLAVTNLPAKTSNEHYYIFFQDIYEHLERGGRFYVVVISGLRNFIKRAVKE